MWRVLSSSSWVEWLQDGVSVVVELRSEVGSDGVASSVPGSDGSGSSVEDEPLSSVLWVPVLESQPVLSSGPVGLHGSGSVLSVS